MKIIAAVIIAAVFVSGCIPIAAVVPMAVTGYQAIQAAEETAREIHKLKEKIKKEGGQQI